MYQLEILQLRNILNKNEFDFQRLFKLIKQKGGKSLNTIYLQGNDLNDNHMAQLGEAIQSLNIEMINHWSKDLGQFGKL